MEDIGERGKGDWVRYEMEDSLGRKTSPVFAVRSAFIVKSR